MKTFEALRIIRSLVDGVNPCTGEMLPDDSPYQQSSILRALFIAVQALERLEERQKREQRLPQNASKSWDESEDKMLCTEFESGLTIMQLAQKHRRTLGAIQSRLEKLGKIPLYNRVQSLSASIKRIDAVQTCELHDKLLASALEHEKQAELEKYRKLEEMREFDEYEEEDEDEEDEETYVARIRYQLQEEMELTEEWQRDKEWERWEEVSETQIRQYNDKDEYWDEENYQAYLEVQDELINDQLNYARSEEEGWFYSDSDPDDWCNQSR